MDNQTQDNSDSDTLGDACDNCPGVDNQDQADNDSDGSGDVCDSDDDDDTVLDDGDGSGTEGDFKCPDGVTTACDDNCPFAANPAQANSDADSFGDACDNCPLVDNEDQTDTDSDGIGDACE